MKVLHIYKTYPPVRGGIENHLRLLAERQAQRGLDVTVLTTAPNGAVAATQENGVQVIRARSWATVASTPLSPALAGWVRRLRPDVTHLQFPYPPGEVAHRLFGRAEATVVSYQSDIVRQRWIGRAYRPVMSRLLRDADRILVSSRAYLESSPHLRPVADRCEIVPLGIDPRRFQVVAGERAAEIRRRAGGPVVLFVGRMRYYKGLDVLIDAAENIDGSLVLVGAGPMENSLRRQAAGSRAASRIAFAGEVSDEELPHYYAAADVVALPSSHRSEAFGLVLLEAMAAGKPVVSTELGTGTSFVNQDGSTGLVVAERDAAALAGAINRLLRDSDERRRMGDNGRLRIEREFHVDRMVDRIVKIYGEALAGPRRRS